MGRVRGMGLERWPRIVAEALGEHLGTGTWADYGYTLLGKYGLLGKWKEEIWTEKTWSKLAMETLKEGAKEGGQKIARRGDLGTYTKKHKELCQGKYIKGRNGNDIRAEIKERIEWGKYLVKEDQ